MNESPAPFTFFDSPEMPRDPFPVFAALRKNAPVFRPPGNAWVVSTYEDAVRVIRDPETFSSQLRVMTPDDEAPPSTILFDDPPIHTRTRGLLSGAFTPRVLELQRPAIQANCELLVNRMLASETCDFVAGIAYPLPVTVIAAMLGVRDGDLATFKHWSDAIIENVASTLFERSTDPIDEITSDFDAYFTKQLDRFREEPRDNLLGALSRARSEDGYQLSRSDLLAICRVLLVAGNETTTGLIVNVARVFDKFPDVLAQLKRRPDLVPSMIEETLRYYPPFPVVFRRVACEVDLHGVTLPKDSRLVVLIASANRDERVFDCPEDFVVDRAPSRHLSFGRGIHHCLGAPLARLETRIVLETLIPRINNMRIEGGIGSAMALGGPKELRVRFG